ncbi:MAG: thiopurine S-methyltransferase [Gammaproteobacteria bacterium]|nr:thiopurine S-methyltransferase [Gammaproteobacteria bacterium]
MDTKFWLERWRQNQIGFHQPQFNKRLIRHWPALQLDAHDRVFVPLCGKSLDMRWLRQQGHSVVGVELSPMAVEAFFAEGDESYEVEKLGALRLYHSDDIRIYCGDVFELTARELAGVSAVFDRGALVALPPDPRRRFVDHLLRILPIDAQILLLTVEYDQNLVAGPPHAVHPDEVHALYAERCRIERLETQISDEAPPHFQAQGVRRVGESAYRIIKEG